MSAIVAAVALLGVMISLFIQSREIREARKNARRSHHVDVSASAPGRRYWQRTGTFWRDNYPGRRARRFHQVLDEVYQEAIKRPPPAAPTRRPPRRSPPSNPGQGRPRTVVTGGGVPWWRRVVVRRWRCSWLGLSAVC